MAKITTGGYVAKHIAAAVNMKTSLISNCSSAYTDIFNKKIESFKVGSTVTIPREALFTAQDGIEDGSTITSFQDITEDPIQAEINVNTIVGVKISDTEATFALDKPKKSGPWLNRVIVPIGRKMGVTTEAKGFNIFGANADQVVVVDAIGTAKYTAKFKELMTRIKQAGGVGMTNIAYVDSNLSSLMTSEVEEYFNPAKGVAKAYTSGSFVGMYGGMGFNESELLRKHVCGCGGVTLTLAADYVEGASTLSLVDGSTCVVGDKIELPFKAVNQQSEIATSYNATRTIKAVNGNAITINPIYFADNQLANVSADAADLVAADTVTGLGTSGSTYSVYPVYPKDAFAFAPVELPPLGALTSLSGVATVKNMKVRIATGDDVAAGESKQRADMKGSFIPVRPEWMGEFWLAE